MFIFAEKEGKNNFLLLIYVLLKGMIFISMGFQRKHEPGRSEEGANERKFEKFPF